MRRIINNIKHHTNWLRYYKYKYFGAKSAAFTFNGRNGGLKIPVPRRLLHTYKECFFDETYFIGMPKTIKPGNLQTVLDIGANVGYFSLFIFSHNTDARIFAYEPMPMNFDLLEKHKNKFHDLDLTIVNKAVSGEKKKIILNYDASDSFSTIASIFDNARLPDKYEVDSTTITDIVNTHNLGQIDFLKLDCEGAEYGILYGAPDSLLDNISMLSIETHLGKGENENINAMADFLRSRNFEVKTIRSMIWGWRPTRFIS